MKLLYSILKWCYYVVLANTIGSDSGLGYSSKTSKFLDSKVDELTKEIKETTSKELYSVLKLIAIIISIYYIFFY